MCRRTILISCRPRSPSRLRSSCALSCRINSNCSWTLRRLRKPYPSVGAAGIKRRAACSSITMATGTGSSTFNRRAAPHPIESSAHPPLGGPIHGARPRFTTGSGTGSMIGCAGTVDGSSHARVGRSDDSACASGLGQPLPGRARSGVLGASYGCARADTWPRDAQSGRRRGLPGEPEHPTGPMSRGTDGVLQPLALHAWTASVWNDVQSRLRLKLSGGSVPSLTIVPPSSS